MLEMSANCAVTRKLVNENKCAFAYTTLKHINQVYTPGIIVRNFGKRDHN